MEVTYRINPDDVQAAQWHYVRSSRTLRAVYWRTFVSVLVLVLGLTLLVVGLMDWGWMFGGVSYVTFAALWTARWPHIYRESLNKSTQKILKEGRNEVLHTEFRMVLDDGGFRVASELGESLVKWGVVERVEESEAHIFITIGSMTTYAVPKWAFETKRRAEEFFEAAQTFHRRSLA